MAEYPPSPVKSDQWLWEGELPFTAFGQNGYGRLDLRVFDQGTWWVDIYGQEHLLTEMSDEYLNNVRNHLLTNGPQFHLAAIRRHMIERILCLAETPGTPEDMDGYTDYVLQREDPCTVDWEQWLRATILFLTLEEELVSRVQE